MTSLVLFNGADGLGNRVLWVTNGTAVGTSELSVSGANTSGLAPEFFTVYGSEVLFGGIGEDSTKGLWVTNGTAIGTSELSVTGAYSEGLFASSSPGYTPDFTAFGSEVIFDGLDSDVDHGLWITNGTAEGTSEISVSGSYCGDLAPGSFAVLGSEVLFDGLDFEKDYNLWVTNGTAAGTSELSIAGADFLNGRLGHDHAGVQVHGIQRPDDRGLAGHERNPFRGGHQGCEQ